MRVIAFTLSVVFSALISSARADTVQVGPFEVILPSSMQVEPCPGCFDDEAHVLIGWWPKMTAGARAEAVKQTKSFWEGDEEVLEMVRAGRLGRIELVVGPVEKRDADKSFGELHSRNCQEFREAWGYGFGSFDAKTNIGHCAMPFGAMVYTVCAYHTEAVLCGSGLHVLEIVKLEDDEALNAAIHKWELGPSPEAEEAVLAHLREAALVEPVEKIVRSAMLTRD